MPSADDNRVHLPATAIILAGGKSVRMDGRHKALLPWAEGTLLEHVAARVSAVAREVIVVGGDEVEAPAQAAKVTDIYPGCGPLGGLHAGLAAARFECCLTVACDMPFVGESVVRALLELSAGYDAAVPRAADGLHPLLAVYSRRCLPAIEEQLRDGNRRMISFLGRVRVRWVTERELRPFDPDLLSLFNINAWPDYERAQEIARAACDLDRRTPTKR